MAEDILKLQVGDIVQLQHVEPEKEGRYAVTVIGFLPGESLLVTMPRVNGKVRFIREGQSFAVRLLRGSHVHGFMAKVLQTAVKPYPYLHLSFPKEVESIAVRNAERVETRLSAEARNTRMPDTEEYWRAIAIRDLSASGARLESVNPLGEAGEMLQLRFQLLVCGVEEDLNVAADIRNVVLRGKDSDEEGGQRYSTGIEFHLLNRFQKVLLHDYVLEQRLKGE